MHFAQASSWCGLTFSRTSRTQTVATKLYTSFTCGRLIGHMVAVLLNLSLRVHLMKNGRLPGDLPRTELHTSSHESGGSLGRLHSELSLRYIWCFRYIWHPGLEFWWNPGRSFPPSHLQSCTPSILSPPNRLPFPSTNRSRQTNAPPQSLARPSHPRWVGKFSGRRSVVSRRTLHQLPVAGLPLRLLDALHGGSGA